MRLNRIEGRGIDEYVIPEQRRAPYALCFSILGREQRSRGSISDHVPYEHRPWSLCGLSIWVLQVAFRTNRGDELIRIRIVWGSEHFGIVFDGVR